MVPIPRSCELTQAQIRSDDIDTGSLNGQHEKMTASSNASDASEEEYDMEYVPDLSTLEALPFDDGSLARQFEEGLHTMDSWKEYSAAIIERDSDLQKSLDSDGAEDNDNDKNPREDSESDAVDSKREVFRKTKISSRRKEIRQMSKAPNPHLQRIDDVAMNEDEISSDSETGGLSATSEFSKSEDESMESNHSQVSNVESVSEISYASDIGPDLDAVIQEEEDHLR